MNEDEKTIFTLSKRRIEAYIPPHQQENPTFHLIYAAVSQMEMRAMEVNAQAQGTANADLCSM